VDLEPEPTRLSRKEIQAMIAQQMHIARGGYAIPPVENCGHPYPAMYDLEEYPKGYVIPRFRTFSGEGNKDLNPEQHLAHFVASCGDTGDNDALLLRQFPQSLIGIAFQWYYSLENNSIRTWDELADSFRARFVMVFDKINIADLASTKPKKRESMMKFINRWRNLSIKCDRTITEDEAVNLIMKNIDRWMGMLLGVTKVNTFKDLLRSVSNMERISPHTMSNFMNNRPQRGAKAETKVAFTSLKDKMVANTNIQSGSSDTSGNNYNRGPRPNPRGSLQAFDILKQKKNKQYSFRWDKVSQTFRGALKNGLALPASKRPEDADKSDEPNLCPYHRVLGHSVEDCWVFKDWVEKAYKNGEITLPKGFLQHPAAHEQANTISHEEEKSPDQLSENKEEQWTTHLSKKSIKMLKALKKEPGMKWKDDITPMIPPRPRVYYKVDQSKDQTLKKKKKHKNNKSKKNKIE
jgi:Retrotransposon gag protein